MHVIATAGHVDHGKSTLVRALTGMEPDRWAEERRRGMTIDLGFAWTTLEAGQVVAFVDVPGHERFVPNMLAGVGPVPAVLFVVAADEGWMPQSAEHLAALDALGVRHGLLAVTKADVTLPARAGAGRTGGTGAEHAGARAVADEARRHVAATSLGEVEVVTLSAVTGAGLDALRSALGRLVSRLPPPDPSEQVRLWVDRSFTIRGSGTVVTATLCAGLLRVGDELELASTGRAVRVRGLQTLGEPRPWVEAIARVAVNLRGVEAGQIRRGDALITPGHFAGRDTVDVRLRGDPVRSVPRSVVVHVGSAAVPASVRPLGADTARLGLSRALPLRVGDRILVRDPGRHYIAGGADVLDVAPPPLGWRGAAAARGAVLTTMDGRPDERSELRRRRVARREDLERMGVRVSVPPVAGDWLVDPEHWQMLRRRLPAVVAQHRGERPLETGMTVEALRHALDLPDRALVEALIEPPLVCRAGRVGPADAALPEPVAQAVERVRADLAVHPFLAPDAAHLDELGLGAREIAAAVRVNALVRLASGVVLLPDAPQAALDLLARLPQPFTVSEARRALSTTRRVVIPLLEALDRHGSLRRLPDDRRVVG